MTPKEKAEDLLYQMRYDHMSGTLTKRKAKRCTLIAVDEIIQTLNYDIKDLDVIGSVLIDLIIYWRQVKEEINKL